MFHYSKYQDVSIGQGSASLLGSRINIYLYIIDGLLIDTGPGKIAPESSVFFNKEAIKQVALTHVHEDHSGMAAWLQAAGKVPVYLHQNSLDYAASEGRYPLYRHLMWGKRPAFHATAMPEQLVTDHFFLRAIDAPGHTSAHHIFYEEKQGWLFTGDLFLGTKQLVAFYEEDLLKTIDSIKMILTLDFDTIFCAHSGAWTEGKKLFQQKLDFLTGLQSRVEDLRSQGLDNRQIDKRLFPKKPPITYVSRGQWSSYNMIRTI